MLFKVTDFFLLPIRTHFSGYYHVRDKVSSVVTYDSVLRGFEKVFLEPGESEKVSFTLTLDDLSLVGKDLERVFEPGEFEIMLGSSSNDIRLSMTVGLQ